MKKYLESLLKRNEKPLGTILYIGAGSGSELAAINSLEPRKLVAVEASAELYSALYRKSKKCVNVISENVWILPPGQKTATASLYSNPRYNSLCADSNIELTHSNVKLQNRVTVSGEPLDSFVDALHMDGNMANILVIDTPNAKNNFLPNSKCCYLQYFDFLVLIKSAEEVKKSELSNTDQLYFFDEAILANEESSSFDFFIRNEKICKLQKQLELLKDAEKVNADQLQPAKKEADNEIAKLRDELDSIQQNTRTQADNDLIENQKLRLNIKELNDEIRELKSLNEKATIDLAECITERDAKHKLHQESKSLAESLNTQQGQLKAELTKKNSSFSLAQKMHAKAQVDLDNLREKYSEKLSSERELIDLIKELRAKLAIASKYYFKLQQEHPELLASDASGKEN
ncbi:hypothetical protein [Alteromonas sp. BMJM2]|uniref:hypothetical protein n=1 Tax=Alteromonas sp. BMJM2 TaxID=2954241 RepID=UPI0022B3CC25|nr:hypothetical protein [Alteromonas sp. BMJM2]